MAARIRDHDWAATALGPREAWPHSLRVALGLCLNSSFPMAIYWGPDFHLIYNDGWSPIPGPRHPAALGRPAREVWPDIWHIVGPQLEDVMRLGRGFSTENQHLPMTRHGVPEDSYWDYSFTPIVGDDGHPAGILNQGHEVTARMFERQRQSLMLALTDRLRPLDDEGAIIRAALATIGPELAVAEAGFVELDPTGAVRIDHVWRRDGDAAPAGAPVPSGADLRAGTILAVEDTRADPRIAGTPMAVACARHAVRAFVMVPVLRDGAYDAALFLDDDIPRRWTRHHETLLGEVVERVRAEVARARSGAALRASEERYRLIFEQANDIILTADLEQRITAANPAAYHALATAPGTLIGRSIRDFVDPGDYRRTEEMLRRKLRGGGTTRYDLAVRADGQAPMLWDINSSLAIDPAGQPIGLHAIARDVTERHAFEASQRRLINELNHRVKNMLALVQALALQSFRGGKPPEEAQAAFQARLSALAAAHDLLTREKWGGATLDEVIAVATRALARLPERVSQGGPPVTLAPKTAVSLVMAFHELATNAARHGALSGEAGHLHVGWRCDEGRLAIEWRESGGPPAEPPARRGFGLRMVERALASDLAATVLIDFAETGLYCAIEAPLPPAAGQPQR